MCDQKGETMAARWHFNPETGKTGRCDAKKRCRFAEGDVEPEHYPTAELAQQAYAAKMQDSLVPTATKDAAADTDAHDQMAALREACENYNKWADSPSGYTLEEVALIFELSLKEAASLLGVEEDPEAQPTCWQFMYFTETYFPDYYDG